MISSRSEHGTDVLIVADRERNIRKLVEATPADYVVIASPSGWMPEDLSTVLEPLRTLDAEAVYVIPQSLSEAPAIDRAYLAAKVFRTSLLRGLPFSDGASLDLEITQKLQARDARRIQMVMAGSMAPPVPLRSLQRMALQARAARFSLQGRLYLDPGAAILDSFSVARRFNAWMADTVRPYAGKRVLEIGAGMGNMSSQLAPGRDRYVATDLDIEHLARLSARLRHLGHLETGIADLSERGSYGRYRGQLDTVVCLNVLEHIEDDGAGLWNMHDVLAPGGRAIVLVPCGQELFGSLDEVLGHFRRYSAAELRGKMEAAGFEVERVLEFNRVSRPGWFLNARVIRRTGISKGQLRIFDRTVWFWRWADRWLPWGPTSVIGIGRKK